MAEDRVLTESELNEALAGLPGWEVRDDWLRRTFTTPGWPTPSCWSQRSIISLRQPGTILI
jgi:pterin-4a-carbinolamine dehydratase